MPKEMDPVKYRVWRTCYEHMHQVLTTAQDKRNERRTISDSGLPGWVTYERERALAGVNWLRHMRDLPPVDMATIVRVEGMAAGHIDYTAKFAVYCADLGYGVDEVRP